MGTWCETAESRPWQQLLLVIRTGENYKRTECSKNKTKKKKKKREKEEEKQKKINEEKEESEGTREREEEWIQIGLEASWDWIKIFTTGTN